MINRNGQAIMPASSPSSPHQLPLPQALVADFSDRRLILDPVGHKAASCGDMHQ
jgi:hypothetical protein